MGQLAGGVLLVVFGANIVLILVEQGQVDLLKVVSAFTVIAPIFVILERLAFAIVAQAAVDRGFVRGRPAVLIIDRAEVGSVASTQFLHSGVDLLACFVLSRREDSDDLSPTDVTVVRQATEFARAHGAAEFAVILPWSKGRALAGLTSLLRVSPLPARLYPDRATRAVLAQRRESHFDPFLQVEIQRAPLSRVERLTKRIFDITVAGSVLLMLLPLLVGTAVAVKLDSPGPAIFRQRRRGFNNRDFMIWKFRTMHVMEDGDQVMQARRGDARITSIGSVLRKTSIDELPQLVNVLRGEMSLVGPRPHALAHDEEYGRQIADYAFRHHVKPGLTGYAQVCGHRGETKTLAQMEKRIEHDLWYINNWSFRLDLKIFFQTFLALVRHEAY